MNSKNIYYHLHTNTMNPCSMSAVSAARAKKEWMCPGCNYPKPAIDQIDVEVQQPGPKNGPLSFVYGFGVSVAQKQLIESFGEDLLHRDIFVGSLSIEGIGKTENWKTVRGRCALIVRGSKNVSHRQCMECGRNVYFAMGSRYLFPSPPPEHEIFESDLSGLIISQRLFDRFALDQWPGLNIEKLPVLSTPKDALHDMISTYK